MASISIAIKLAVLTAVAFLPVLACGFVNGDDDWNFRDNVEFRSLEWDQIRWAWTTKLIGVYQPIAWMFLGAEYESFGIGPRGFHATSLLFHAVNAAVLFLLTRAILVRCRPEIVDEPGGPAILDWSSAFAAALFAEHPLRAINVQNLSVTFISLPIEKCQETVADGELVDNSAILRGTAGTSRPKILNRGDMP